MAIVTAGLLLSVQLSAAQTADPNAEDRTPVVVYTQGGAIPLTAGPAQQLLRYATQRGRIRVIVGLRVAARMEHRLTPSQVLAQRRSLRQIQDGIAARVLGSPAAPGIERFTFIPAMSMYVNTVQLRRLLADPQVATIEKDVVMEPSVSDDDLLIHTPEIWLKHADGHGRGIAVLDTGVDKTHPMFAGGKVVSEACYSTSHPPHTISTCPGGSTSSVATGSGVPCTGNGCYHGTHVASIAAGNSSVLDGVARDADIIAIKVASLLNGTSAFYNNDALRGLSRVYAVRDTYKIASVNMSFNLNGTRYNAQCDGVFPMVALAIKNLRDAGIAPVVASGNESQDSAIDIPACVSTAIAVGNTTNADLINTSSNHSALVDLMAPGTNIKAAVPKNLATCPGGGPATDHYCVLTGTSMAAPHVAGGFADLKDAKPAATVDQILEALKCTGKTVHLREHAPNPVELAPAKPRIDLLGAYNYLLKPPNVARNWDFSNAKQALDFTPLIGKWAVSGGRYEQTPIQQGWIGSSVDNCNHSLQITAAMTRIDPGTTTFSNSGIIIKSIPDYLNKNIQGGYWIAYNKCKTNNAGDCTGKDPDKAGQAVFWKLSNLNSGTLLCKKQVPVNVNGLNTIKVVSSASTHTYYLNGKLVCAVHDSSFTSGPILAAAYIAAAGGHAYQLDYLDTIAKDVAPHSASDVLDPAALEPKPNSNPPGTAPGFSTPISKAVSSR